MIVAIDGTASSGKGTLARELSEKLNLKYLDTGILYRIIGKEILTLNNQRLITKTSISIAKNLTWEKVNSYDKNQLRSLEVSDAASRIAKIEPLRKELINFQREFTKIKLNGYNGSILDGRDIGTIILPNADFKFFLDAKPEVRAKRRTQELIELNYKSIYQEVLDDLIKRDERDKLREVSPLIRSDDAFYIDTTLKSMDEIVEIALDFIKELKNR